MKLITKPRKVWYVVDNADGGIRAVYTTKWQAEEHVANLPSFISAHVESEVVR